MALIKLLNSIFHARGNLKTGFKAKFFSYRKLLFNKLLHHSKRSGKHIQKHHKKIIGISGILGFVHFVLIKTLGIHLLGIKILALILSFFGINHNINISAEFNTNLITTLNISTLDEGEKNIIFDNEYKKTPIIIPTAQNGNKVIEYKSSIQNTNTQGFTLSIRQDQDNIFAINEKNINYAIFNLDEIQKYTRIEGNTIIMTGEDTVINFSNIYKNTPIILRHSQSGYIDQDDIMFANTSTTGTQIILTSQNINEKLIGYIIIDPTHPQNDIFEFGEISINDFSGTVNLDKTYQSAQVITDQSNYISIHNISASGFDYRINSILFDNIKRLVFEGKHNSQKIEDSQEIYDDNFIKLIQDAEKIINEKSENPEEIPTEELSDNLDGNTGISVRLIGGDKNQNENILYNMEIEEIGQEEQEKFKEKLRGKGYYENGSGKMVGTGDLDAGEINGEILAPVIIQSQDKVNNQLIEIEIPQGTLLKNQNGSIHTGIVNNPILIDQNNINIFNQKIISAIKVGSDSSNILFKDTSNNNIYATIKIPVTDIDIGDIVNVYYSIDGINTNYMTHTTITGIDGQAFAIFQTNHFTEFYLGENLGNFRINNDAIYTTGYSVTLNTTLVGATQMKFGNTPSQRDSASWTTYTTSYPWILTTGDGIKTVYAIFSGGGISNLVKDEIIVDTTQPTLNPNDFYYHLDGSIQGTTIVNQADPNETWTAYNGVTTGSIGGQTYFNFNGTNQYGEANGWVIGTFPFSLMAWVKADRITGKQTIAGEVGRKTNVYRAMGMSGNKFTIDCANSTPRTVQGTTNIQTGERYHVVAVYASNTSRQLYVNGILEASDTTLCSYGQNGNNRRNIARLGGPNNTNYFDGSIDEVRLYSLDMSSNLNVLDYLYMGKVTAKNLVTFDLHPTLFGTIFSTTDTFAVELSGTNNSIKQLLPAHNDLQKKWTLSHDDYTTGLELGTYDLNLYQTDEYGVTRITAYPGALIVNPIEVIYSPNTYTTGNVVTTLSGLYETDIITNNNSSPTYLFTDNGEFTFEYIDDNNNIGSSIATVDWIDRQGPTISTGYISSGNTGARNGSLYYNGIVNIRADANDDKSGLSGATCQYTTGSTRLPAQFYGTYCEKTGVNNTDLNIRFRIQDNLGNLGTGPVGTYIYDNTPPIGGSFSINNNAPGTSSTGITLNIVCPTDAGVEGIQVAFGTGSSPNNRQSCTSTKTQTLDADDGTKTVYMRFQDALGNISNEISDTIMLDTTAPIVGSGYISAGLTATDGDNLYYKGTINIRANVDDGDGIGINPVACEYTLNGSSRHIAAYHTSYCEAVGITPNSDIYIRFRVKDNLGNLGTGFTGTYIYDNIPPTGGSFVINNNDDYTKDTNVSLNITCPQKVGIGGHEVAYGNTTNPTNRTGCTDTISHTLIAGDGTKTVFMRFRDALQNTTTNTTDTIILDTTGPTISTGYISEGITGNNLSTLYYKGIVTIRANVNDDSSGLSGATCQYTTGGIRGPAEFHGTYCQKTGINQTDLNIRFRIQDNLGNQGTGPVGTYIYDNTPPVGGSFAINNNDDFTSNLNVNLNIICPIDDGIGLVEVAYGETSNPTNWTTCEAIKDYTLSTGDGTKTVYMRFRDTLNNTGDEISDTIIFDSSVPSVSVGYISSGFTAKSNEGSDFYKGIVDIRADISSSIDIDTQTCEYTTGVLRTSAPFYGNGNNGYCEITGLDYQTTLNISFRIKNIGGGLGVGGAGNYYYDDVPPIDGDFVINGGNLYTNSTAVVLTIIMPAMDTGVGGVEVAYCNSDNPTDRNICGPTKDFILTTGDGLKTVYARRIDALHNESPNSISRSITLDETPPIVGTPEMFSGNYTGSYFNGGVYVRSSISDSLSNIKSNSCQVDVGGGRTTVGVVQDSNYCYYTGYSPNDDFDIRFRVQDNANNFGTSLVSSYIYDNTPPVGGSFVINSGNTYTNSGNVTLNITCPTDNGGVGYVQVSHGPEIDPDDNRIICQNTLPYTLSQGDGGKIVYMRFRDALNNTTTNVTDIIILDTTSPILGIPEIYSGNYDGIYFNGIVGIRSSISDILSYPKSNSCQVDTGQGRTNDGVIQDSNYCYYPDYNPESNISIRFRGQDNANNFGTSSVSNYTYDNTPPTVSTGYISSGLTGTDGNNLYYKGTINIRANVSDIGVGLSGNTCEYTTGGSRAPAIFASNYCEATNLSPNTNINIRFRIKDKLGNEGLGHTGAYIYDNTPPSGGSFVINEDTTNTDTRSVTLNITCPTDIGGVSGVQVAYANNPNPSSNWTGCNNTKPHTLTIGNGTKTVYMRFRDALGNTTTSDVTDTIILNIIPPFVSTGFVSSGISAIYGNTGYYKGIVDVRANVIDEGRGLNPNSCEYNTGQGRSPATFNFTYCEVTGLNYTSTLYVQFRIQDDEGTTGLGGTGVYVHDTVAPTQSTMNEEPTYSQGTSNTVSSTISTDTGANNIEYEFCINTSNTTVGCLSAGRSGSNSNTFTGLDDGQLYYYFVRSKDGLSNTTDRSSSTYSTQDNVAPSYTRNTPTSGLRYTSGSLIQIDVSIFEDGSGISDGISCNPKINGQIDLFSGTVTYSTETNKCIGEIILNDNLPDGANYLTIQVPDLVSNSIESDSVTVNYDNTVPSSIVLSISNFTHNTRGNYNSIVTGSITGVRGPSEFTIEYNTGGERVSIGNNTTFGFVPQEGTTNIQVRVNDVGGGPSYSNIFIINKDITGPTTPNLITPENNHIQNTGTVQLTRSTGEDVGAGISGYLRELSIDNFDTTHLSGTTTNTGINISLLTENTYQWRVLSIDNLGNTGVWSQSYNFTIDMTKPTAIIEYNPSTDTYLEVTATITGFSKTGVVVTNNDGLSTHIFTENGEFVFEFVDLAGNTGSATATVTWISTGILYIGTPNSFSFSGNIQSRQTTQEIIKQFTGNDYFFVEDQRGWDNGYYTTISATDLSGNIQKINNNNLFIKTNTIERLDGEANPLVQINSDLNDFVSLSGQLTYIFRNPGTNNYRRGKYGDTPELKIIIPPFTPADTYHGQIVFTIYEH